MVKELEVKVLNIDMDEMEEKIIAAGGQLIGKEYQVNTLIDSTDKPIKSYLDAYLRIRETTDITNKTSTTTLTLKKNIGNDKLRENIEYNVDIEDKESMLKLFSELGFDKTSIGYKERISYKLHGARIDIDKWDSKTYPYPYMEIEVNDEESLINLVNILEIDNKNISKKSIVELRNEIGLE